MAAGSSLRARAILALALVASFYGFIVALLIVLVGAPIRLVSSTGWGSFQTRLALMAWVCAGLLLWSVVPRRRRFQAPGPRLTAEEHPRLFAWLEETAQASGQALPAEVYLSPEATAFVTTRGGFMGCGGSRVMGVGFPLLAGLSVAELRSVVAHEFGHFAGGELRLGPWIHTARAAMLRAVEQRPPSTSLLRRDLTPGAENPSQGLFLAFLRLTQSISREHELAADRLALRVAGRQAAASALAEIERLSAGFHSYIQIECLPVLQRGFHPPLARGLRRFLAAPSVRAWLGERAVLRADRPEASPYDSHPSTEARIRELHPQYAPGPAPTEAECASSLIGDVPALERELLRYVYGEPEAAKLQPVEWEESAARALVPGWKDACTPHAARLRTLRIAEIPALARDLERVVARLQLPGGKQAAGALLYRALALTLVREGWTAAALPGEPVELRRGSERVQPAVLLEALALATPAAADAADWCSGASVAELRLWAA